MIDPTIGFVHCTKQKGDKIARTLIRQKTAIRHYDVTDIIQAYLLYDITKRARTLGGLALSLVVIHNSRYEVLLFLCVKS